MKADNISFVAIVVVVVVVTGVIVAVNAVLRTSCGREAANLFGQSSLVGQAVLGAPEDDTRSSGSRCCFRCCFQAGVARQFRVMTTGAKAAAAATAGKLEWVSGELYLAQSRRSTREHSSSAAQSGDHALIQFVVCGHLLSLAYCSARWKKLHDKLLALYLAVQNATAY